MHQFVAGTNPFCQSCGHDPTSSRPAPDQLSRQGFVAQVYMGCRRRAMISRLSGRLPTPIKLMLANVLLNGCTFLTGIVLARGLGPAGRGQLGIYLMWSQAIANVALCGTHVTLARKAAQDVAMVSAVYKTAYKLVTLLSLAAMALYLLAWLVVSAKLHHTDWFAIGLSSLIIPFSALNAMQIQIELGRSNFAAFNLVRTMFSVLTLVFSLVLYAIHSGAVVWYLVAQLSSGVIGSLVGQALIARNMPPAVEERQIDPREILFESKHFGLLMLASAFAAQGDRLLVSAVFPAVAVGIYLVAGSLAQIQHTIGEALSQMFFSRTAAVKSVDHLDVGWLSQRMRQAICIYAVICCSALIVGPFLIGPIFGKDYAQSSILLYILLPAFALQGMSRPFEETLRGLDSPRVLLVSLVASIATLALFSIAAAITQNIFLVAAGAFASFLTSFLISSSVVARKLHVPLHRLVIPRWKDAIDLTTQLLAKVRSKPVPAPVALAPLDKGGEY